jgi:hypothetical protein
MTQICLLAVVLLTLPTAPLADDKEEKVKEQRAELQRRSILQACVAYQVTPASNMTYPTILLELVKPPFGGASYLKDGKKDLIDPWGKMFQYAVVKDKQGNFQPYVWTEHKVNGKLKVIGTKPPEPKKK